jgi:hypothetical protein
MNPAVFYVLKWEKELEIQRSARASDRRATDSVEPPPRGRRPQSGSSAVRHRRPRRRACALP